MANTDTRRQLAMSAMILGGGLLVLAPLLDVANILAGTPQIPGDNGSPLFSVAIRQWLIMLSLIVWTIYAVVAVAMGPDENPTA